MTTALGEIAAERQRQIEVERWTPQHDDKHSNGELAEAAGCYAWGATRLYDAHGERSRSLWPWHVKWWKPTDRRRDLVKAGALIVAEIERLDRAIKKHPDELYFARFGEYPPSRSAG